MYVVWTHDWMTKSKNVARLTPKSFPDSFAVMLHILPVEVSLAILSYLPLPSLCSLSALSRQWFNFVSTNRSTIFRKAAILHGFTPPGTSLLKDVLSVCTGSPWAGATDWRDFCASCPLGRRSVQLRRNWEGNGRVVARMLSPPVRDVHRIKVDEKAGICITTHMFGGLWVTHLFSSTILWSLPMYHVHRYAHCEYENGYLVFDCIDGKKEVWRMANELAAGEVAAYSPPDEDQRRVSAFVATIHHRYAPRGHFRPWAKLSFPELTRAYRLAYPTLVSAGGDRAFLHDVRTGALVQTIEINVQSVCYVDVNERHLFVCEPKALHVFSRADRGAEVLRIPNDVSISNVVFTDSAPGDPFVAAIPLRSWPDLLRSTFLAAHVSRDGRDLVILGYKSRILLVRDFERVCRGEISLEDAGQVVRLAPRKKSYYLAYEHGRICAATVSGLYIFTVDRDSVANSLKAVVVRPFVDSPPGPRDVVTCMQLTDRRVYFTWGESSRRDIPLFKDDEGAPAPSSPGNEPWVDFEFSRILR
ncbi:hypothetical protein F5148DRAFT_623674 [Russula earlei]|uniref:Uncharacterized protein n=1 Tax=Russula earlei TaxID=71964 RepID=A0ACC0UF51_9AGAM|nr:hypothetical protein F5148DRAFT_623674 [Russula earlei]